MPRLLTLSHAGTEVDVAVEKIDRKKLYGYVELEVEDGEGRACETATLADDGQTLIPRGGIGHLYLSRSGQLLSPDDLTAIRPSGEPIEPVPSSFESGIQLDHTAEPKDILLTGIAYLYRLVPDGGVDLPEALQQAFADGTIYRFRFSYRGGTTAYDAFALRSGGGDLFMLVGTPLDAEYLTFEQIAPDLDDETEAADLLEFELF